MLFFLGYYIGDVLWTLGALAGGVGFVLGVGIIVLYDRKVIRKKNIGYTITAYAGDALLQAMRNEEHTHG